MYICICKGITEESFQKALTKTSSPQEAMKMLGVGSDCGLCLIDQSHTTSYCHPGHSHKNPELTKKET